MPLILSPPEAVRGMKSLERSAFEKIIPIPALRVEGKHCSTLLKQLNKCLFNQPRLKNIVSDTSGDLKKKIILLNSETKFNNEQECLVKNCGCEELVYELQLKYDYWSCEQTLRAVLPEDIIEITTAFETIGHIAHMNLRECQLTYKKLIGQVILDKNSPQIKTVVNKVDTIDETFRFFHMELLAGEDEMVATTKEHGCLFCFNFSKVYWNSRLQNEHKRLVDSFAKTDIVCDMFAGVGPFAIPAAKKGCVVYANDLNPESFSSLEKNCKLNDVEKNVHCFNMDARDFIIHLVENRETCDLDHVIMNLPATAVHFLDVFKGIFSHCSHGSSQKLPTIHCYCFSKADNPDLDVQHQIESVLGLDKLDDYLIHNVRNVAPKKMMLCVSFPLPYSVAFEKQTLRSTRRKNENGEKAESEADCHLKRARIVQD